MNFHELQINAKFETSTFKKIHMNYWVTLKTPGVYSSSKLCETLRVNRLSGSDTTAANSMANRALVKDSLVFT
jgi:hypothetical protein